MRESISHLAVHDEVDLGIGPRGSDVGGDHHHLVGADLLDDWLSPEGRQHPLSGSIPVPCGEPHVGIEPPGGVGGEVSDADHLGWEEMEGWRERVGVSACVRKVQTDVAGFRVEKGRGTFKGAGAWASPKVPHLWVPRGLHARVVVAQQHLGKVAHALACHCELVRLTRLEDAGVGISEHHAATAAHRA
jgi:hypothetical protein